MRFAHVGLRLVAFIYGYVCYTRAFAARLIVWFTFGFVGLMHYITVVTFTLLRGCGCTVTGLPTPRLRNTLRALILFTFTFYIYVGGICVTDC